MYVAHALSFLNFQLHGSAAVMRHFNKCISSENSVVHTVSYHGVFLWHMFSPIGANAIFCCNYLDATLSHNFVELTNSMHGLLISKKSYYQSFIKLT